MDPDQPLERAKSIEHDEERLARRLREAREYLGLSQEFVAEQLRVPRATVSAMENGKRKISSLELKQLALLYRRDYAYFLGDGPKSDEEPIGAALFRATKRLSTSDREQVLQFAQFLHHAGSGPRPSGEAAGAPEPDRQSHE